MRLVVGIPGTRLPLSIKSHDVATEAERDADARHVQERLNLSVWARRDFVRQYSTDVLCPAETALLGAYREQLAGRVLELGCGAGRLTGHLIALGGSVHGIDVSPRMVDHCNAAYPRASFSVRDLCDLSAFETGSLDAVVATNNVLDVLDDPERRRVLAEIGRLLAPAGLLWMSSHNRDHLPYRSKPSDIRGRNLVRTIGKVALMPMRVRNHRRLLRFEHFEPGYAVVNDEAHHFTLLHYYISRDAQERQFGEVGFELVECMDSDARVLAPGEGAPEKSELHYLARPSPSTAPAP